MMPKTIAFIVTLDTKGDEAQYIKDIIEKRGHTTLVIDISALEEPPFTPDITSREVAEAAGSTLEEVRAYRSAGKAAEVMTIGLVKIVKDLYNSGEIDGILSIGGGMGTGMATTAMRELPVGFPKIMVSIKAGQAGAQWYVGAKDVTLMPSVSDIEGLNRVTKRVLANAAGAITGMVEAASEVEIEEKPLVVMSELGTTTACGLKVKSALEDKGYEVVIFAGAGVGGRCQEDFIRTNPALGVIELGIQEVSNDLLGGLAGCPNRLEAAGEKGIPQLITPGNVDFIAFLGPETVPDRYKNRHLHAHNPQATLMRVNADEMKPVAETVAERLNRASGPVKVLIPNRGFSSIDREGREYYDPAADRVFIDSLKSSLNPSIPVREIDAHINDGQFAQAVVDEFLQLVAKSQ